MINAKAVLPKFRGMADSNSSPEIILVAVTTRKWFKKKRDYVWGIAVPELITPVTHTSAYSSSAYGWKVIALFPIAEKKRAEEFLAKLT